MNVIIDSNALFSALIKDAKTRCIILEYDGLFLFPSYIFVEVEKHKGELLKKSGMTNVDFAALLQLILKKVMIVPNEVLAPYRKEAYEIVKNVRIFHQSLTGGIQSMCQNSENSEHAQKPPQT